MREAISLIFVLLIFGLLFLAQYTAKPIPIGSSSGGNGFREFDLVEDSTGYDMIYIQNDSIKHVKIKRK